MKKKKSLKKTHKRSGSAEKSKKLKKEILADIWPQERDFFERPERFRYVRKLIKPKTCVFCQGAKAKIESGSLVLWRDEDSMVMLNKYPYNTGHLLILPTLHVGDIWNVDETTLGKVMRLMKQSARFLTQSLGCHGMNMGLNHGAVAGAGLPGHIHWHIVPRWSGDTNFFPLIAETKALPETLTQTYSKLKPYFAEMGQI